MTSYLYDWNMLPLAANAAMAEGTPETYKEFPPLQAPESYNLDQVVAEMKAAKTASHVGE